MYSYALIFFDLLKTDICLRIKLDKKMQIKTNSKFCDKQDPHPTIFRNGNVLPNSLINILIKRL